MTDELMSAELEEYLINLVPPRPAEMRIMEESAKETGFPIIGPAAGNMCYLIARLIGAKNVFELGSGYGYSTAWFAMAVKENGGGVVHHVVWDEELSQRAHTHLSKLGLDDLVRYHVGEAIQKLKEMPGPFDLIFNDIDKTGYPDSLPVTKEKLKPGGVLIIDNMLWHGRIFDKEDESADTKAIREFTRLIAADPDWIVSLMPIRDGLIVAYKR